MEKSSKKGRKILAAVLTVVLVILLSLGTTLIVGRSGALPAVKPASDGLSAYELAKAYGYTGTVQEWLTSLKGKSAYELAKDSGYTGTEKDFSAAMAAGAAAPAVSVKSASFSASGDLIFVLSDGSSLNLGKAVGADGKNGTDGVGITSAVINGDGHLVMTFSDGKSVDLDKVVGANGANGVGVTGAEINSDGELVLAFSNGQRANVGGVVGAKGEKGDAGQDGKDGQNGADGKDGIGVAETTVNAAGELLITTTDGSTSNLGRIIGKDGKDGAKGDKGDAGQDGKNGADGKDGKNGTDGIGVTSAEINSDGELVLMFSNGQRANVGGVIGAKGDRGSDGQNGKDGNGVKRSEINRLGELVLTYTDGSVENLGAVIGAKGDKGDAGQDGKDGADGKDGVGIESVAINDGKLNIRLTNGTDLDLGDMRGADGAKGEKGDAGQDGKDGQNGADGKDGIGVAKTEVNAAGELVITYTDGSTTNLGCIVGKDGKDGAKGEKGDAGQDGKDGENGADGKDGVGVAKTEINAAGELVITYTDGNTTNLGRIIGKDGKDGAKGEKGDVGQDGKNGADGKDGENGADGKDGIGIAKTEVNAAGELMITYTDGSTTNLGRIVGKDGKDGAKGEKGDAGQDGKNGADGKDGQNGADGKDGRGITAATVNGAGELVLTFSDATELNLGKIKGEKGDKGEPGAAGQDGNDGKDGVGIANVRIADSGILTVTLTNGTDLHLGNIKGADGIGITRSAIGDDGHLVLTYSDGNSTDLGLVVGKNGADGIDGKPGADGVGIKDVTVSGDGVLIVTLSTGEVKTLGNIKGEKGEPGKDGVDGKTAFELYQQAYPDYTGTYTEWLATLKGEKGDVGAAGRGILKTEISGTKLVIYYTDNTYEEHDLSGLIKGDDPTDYSQLSFIVLSDGTYGVRANDAINIKDLVSVEVPAMYKGIAVTQIMGDGFKGAVNLESITLPIGLKKINAHAFDGCTALSSVVIPDTVTTIKEYAFYPSGVTSISLDTTKNWTIANVYGNGLSSVNTTLMNNGTTILSSKYFSADISTPEKTAVLFTKRYLYNEMLFDVFKCVWECSE